MGTTYTAHTVIGVEIEADRLYKQERTKAFDHDYPDDWVVDPKTQERLWEDVTLPAKGVVFPDPEDSFQVNLDEGIKVGGYLVIPGHKNRAYITLRNYEVAHYDPPRFALLKTDNLDMTEEVYRMHSRLEPLGFWDPERFGIHTFMLAR